MASYDQIGRLLMAAGFSRAAAAGIVGCIAGESGGNPEAVGTGGGGLIGWTPLSSAFPNRAITGNASRDLTNQITDIVAYVKRNGSIADMNKYKDPVQAADHFSSQYERPAVRFSDVKESVARSVYASLGGVAQGSAGSGGGAPALGSGSTLSMSPFTLAPFNWLGGIFDTITGGKGTTVGDIATGVGGITNNLSALMHFMGALFHPQLWLRLGSFLIGIIALGAGLWLAGDAMGLTQDIKQAAGSVAMLAAK